MASRLRGGAGSAASRALLALTALYLALAIGPLAGLLFHQRLGALLTPEAREVVVSALGLTLKSSVIATLFSCLLGTPAALCLARVEFRGRELANALVDLPISLPPLVLGVALLLTWGRQGLLGRYFALMGLPLSFTFLAVVIAQFVVASPYFVRIAKTAIEQVPRSLEEASACLGAGPARTWLRVTLPLARRGLVAAVVTCWARAMGEFGATVLFAGNVEGRTQTMPLAVFTTAQYDINSSIALSLIMVIFSLAAFVVAQVGLRRSTAQGEALG